MFFFFLVSTIDTKKLVKSVIYFKTCFEDLSNDLMYEIFDYLNEYEIYESFYDLNQRFKNLLIKSNFPIKIKFPCISKLDFNHYYHRIILRNKHRIILFHLTNPFILDHISFQNLFDLKYLFLIICKQYILKI